MVAKLYKTSRRISEGAKRREEKQTHWEGVQYYGDIKGILEDIYQRYFKVLPDGAYQKLYRAALNRHRRFYGLDSKYTGSGKLKTSIC